MASLLELQRAFEELRTQSLIDSDLENGTETVSKIILEHLDKESVEIEARLGYMGDSSFDSDIGLEFYQKIMIGLESCVDWDERTLTITTDYIDGNHRLTIADQGTTRSCIHKTRLSNSDFEYENSPFDVRVSVSVEKPSNPSDFMRPLEKCLSRKKKRTTYRLGYWIFDLTEVQMKENSIVKKTFEFELELDSRLCKTKNVNTIHIAHDMLLKIRDMVEMCEPADADEERNMSLISK